GSEQFIVAYHAALSGQNEKKKYRTPAKGSFSHACLVYYASRTFQVLDKSTQHWRRRSLDEICEKFGNNPIAQMETRHVRKLRDEKSATPGASRTRLKALRALFKWALEEELVSDNPAKKVSEIRYITKPHHTWTIEEVEAFEQRHPIGSKARLA